MIGYYGTCSCPLWLPIRPQVLFIPTILNFFIIDPEQSSYGAVQPAAKLTHPFDKLIPDRTNLAGVRYANHKEIDPNAIKS
jgi:hypothetical protein